MADQQNSQNTWFGVSMFLLGILAGAAIMIGLAGGIPTAPRNDVAAPSNPEAPEPVMTATERMEAIATDLDVDLSDFRTCLADTSIQDRVMRQMDMGRAEGVGGTPGNIVLHLETGTARMISGAQPFENFQSLLDAMMQNPADPALPGTAPVNVPSLDRANDHIRGNPNAPIAIIEYSDFECPFCARVHPTYQRIMDEYGDDVMWVYRHFPLASIHPNAVSLAIGSECISDLAGEDAFWSYADAIFEG